MTNALPQMNPVLGTDVPLLQWSSGKTQMRTTPGKGYFAGTVGFHSEAGRYDDFDEACAAAGIRQVEIDEMYHPDGVAAAVEQVWESIVSWATEYTMALPTVEPAAHPAGTDDLYLPGSEDVEQCIKKATDPRHLEVYRQHLLTLRDRREIDAAEQMRLAQLIEDRLDEIAALV